jgi:hypothetical protein
LTEILEKFPEVEEKIGRELERRMEYILERNKAALSPEQMHATEIEAVCQKLQAVPTSFLK